jgi:hypothetical protein
MLLRLLLMVVRARRHQHRRVLGNPGVMKLFIRLRDQPKRAGDG